MFEEQKFLSNGIERELLLGEDEQSEKRKIGAAICSGNRPFLPAFSFKKIILATRSIVPRLSSFVLFSFYELSRPKIGTKARKTFLFLFAEKDLRAQKSKILLEGKGS